MGKVPRKKDKKTEITKLKREDKTVEGRPGSPHPAKTNYRNRKRNGEMVGRKLMKNIGEAPNIKRPEFFLPI